MLAQHHSHTPSVELQDHISQSEPTPSSSDQPLSTDQNEDEINKKIGKWTAKEDDLLRKYVPVFGEKQWRKVSQYIPGRTSIQCLHRWTKILKPGLVKGPWTAEEDQKLVSWVKAEGPTKWAQCASFIHGRSGKQCRERWFNNLNPDVKKGNWTKEEDELIFQLYQKYGSSWSKIAKFIPGRTENAIKNRFYSTLRKLTADKKKDGLERHEDLCLGEEIIVKKDVLDLATATQAPSALYLLLNEKTSTFLPLEDAKKGTSIDSKRIADTTAHQSEKQKQSSFNINGEKVVVRRDAKPEEKDIQEATNKLVNAEIEDNDNAFEDFLVSFNLGKKSLKSENVSHFDALHNKIQSYCHTNIKDLGESVKSLEVSKVSTTVSEMSPFDLSVKPFTQAQRSASAVVFPNTQQGATHTRGNLIITPTPSNNLSLKVPQIINRTASSPVKPLNGFSLYNPMNNNNAFSLLTRASSNQTYDSEGKMNVEQNWALPLNLMAQQQAFARNFASTTQALPNNGIIGSDNRMSLLYNQLFSLEMVLAKTKTDLAYFESCLKQNGKTNLVQENVKIEEVNACFKSRQFYGQRPLETLNSEFEQLLKRRKVE